MNKLLKYEWTQVTGYRTLYSRGAQFSIPPFFFLFSFHFLLLFFRLCRVIKVDRIKVLLELQSFIALHFPFCSLIFHRWYPASVSLKRCLSWQPPPAGPFLKTGVPIKWEVIKVFLRGTGHKLTVTLWVLGFYFDTGRSVIFCLKT